MWINQTIDISGYITQEKYIKGKSFPEIERILGLSHGRLKSGMLVAAFLRLATFNQFDLSGYTQVSKDNFKSSTPKGLDV